MMSKWWRSAAGNLKLTAATPKERLFHTIEAIPREVSGSRMSTRERKQGRIPAVVFSQNYTQRQPSDPMSFVADSSVSRKRLITTERRQIKTILESVELPFFCSTTFPFQILAGSGSSAVLESGKVLPPQEVHMDEKGRILNLVFAWLEEGKELKVDVPVVFKGEDVCPGIKKGGLLNKVRKSIRYICPAEHIPPKIEVDISNLDIGDKIILHDVNVHPDMKLLEKNMEMPVCKIQAMEMPYVGEPNWTHDWTKKNYVPGSGIAEEERS